MALLRRRRVSTQPQIYSGWNSRRCNSSFPAYLVEGLTLLVGKPKRGKSWMALDWVLAIAHGGYAFGTIQCDECDCLYMALEDNQRRMKRRIKQLLPHANEWSPRLTLCHSMKRERLTG